MYIKTMILFVWVMFLLSCTATLPVKQEDPSSTGTSLQVAPGNIVPKSISQQQKPAEPQIDARYLYVPTIDGGRWGLVDDSGALIMAPKYKGIGSFDLAEDGSALALVMGENDLYGYINEKGEERIAPQFNRARRFTEMFVARVDQDGQWGFVASNGKIIIPPQYEMATAMTNGYAAVKKDGEYFFIDRSGKPVMAILPQPCHSPYSSLRANRCSRRPWILALFRRLK